MTSKYAVKRDSPQPCATPVLYPFRESVSFRIEFRAWMWRSRLGCGIE